MRNIIEKIYRKKDIDKIKEKINMLGDVKYDEFVFIQNRLITTILITLIFVFLTNINYLLIPFLVVIYYYLYYYLFITVPLKRRSRKLDREALYFFEVLTLTLESGRNLENSIETTCFNVDCELSNEFKKSLMEVRFGKSLIEALNDMKKRIPSETINNILLNITQTSIFGSSIIDTMNNQIDFLREKQTLEIRGEINKIPNKISIVSVMFVIPLILLIILGPFLIQFIS